MRAEAYAANYKRLGYSRAKYDRDSFFLRYEG